MNESTTPLEAKFEALINQLGDAFASRVLQRMQFVLTRSSNGIALNADDSSREAPTRGRKGGKGRKKYQPALHNARSVGVEQVLEYFKANKGKSVIEMADALGITHTTGFKRVKTLGKALKKVKEGTRTFYIVRPKRSKAVAN